MKRENTVLLSEKAYKYKMSSNISDKNLQIRLGLRLMKVQYDVGFYYERRLRVLFQRRKRTLKIKM
jgi:hypothetical protein